MKRFYKAIIKKVFALFCLLCLCLLESCSSSTPTTKPSIEQSKEPTSSPASKPSIQQRSPDQDPSVGVTCSICGGSGNCPVCGGQCGSYINGSGVSDGTFVVCQGCHGSGKCWNCSGTGLEFYP